MSDAIGHLAFGNIFLKFFGKNWNAPLFFFGSIFPDFSRASGIIFTKLVNPLPEVYLSFMLFHTPIGLLITVLAMSALFEKSIRKMAFFSLLLGVMTHLLLDAGQKAFHHSYLWLYPFSAYNPIKGLWWADESYSITLFLVLVNIIGYSVIKLAKFRSMR